MKFSKKLIFSIISITAATGVFTGCTTSAQKEQDSKIVNVYSARHYDVDKDIFRNFEATTGIKVNLIEGKAPELLERMKREGKDTQADVFVTADIANIYQAIAGDLVQPIESDVVNANIPANLRGDNNEWVGLTQRARIVAYDKDKVKPEDLSTYEDLTNEKWRGKILVRSSDSSYNQSMLAAFIELNGEEKAKTWAKGIVDNMAREPKGNDRDQVKAIAAGEGEIAILNSYYVGHMVNSKDPEEVKAVKKVGVFFPENTHMNVSGVVMNKYSKNKDNAIQLIEYMTGEDVQKQYAEVNYEYPANPKVAPNELLQSWGTYTPQKVNLTKVGEYNKKAVEIFHQVNWK
ncbi:MAG: Fe(3+) ABC transporter substrate-binding protein [Cellulosilyticaceae bacterium]